MRILLSTDELRNNIPGYPGDFGYIVDRDHQDRIVIATAEGRPIAVARWNRGLQLIEGRSSAIHPDKSMSESIYTVLTQIYAAEAQTQGSKVLDILNLLPKNGLPVVPNADLPAYLASFSTPVRTLIVTGMQAVFQDKYDVAAQAFQAAAKRLSEHDSESVPSDSTGDSGVRMVKIHKRHSGKGYVVHLDIASRRQGDLQFRAMMGDATSKLEKWQMHDGAKTGPTGDFTLLGTLLPTGKHDVEYIAKRDRVVVRIKPPAGEFFTVLAGEVASVALENSAKALVKVRHQFWRWTENTVSAHEQPGILHLRELLKQLAERVELNVNLVEVTDAANVALGKFRAHNLPAYVLVSTLLAEHSLYGEFSREGKFRVRTIVEEDQGFRAKPPLTIQPDSWVEYKGDPTED